MTKCRVVWALGMAAVVSGTGSAPLPQMPASPAFEVASIKPIKCCEPLPFAMTFQPGGRFRAKAVTLRWLIAYAYGIPIASASHQTSGGPKWIDADRFDIEAKAETDFPRSPSGPTPEMFSLVRSLLADRFKVIVHTEKKDAPIYALILAKKDRRLGPQIRPTLPDCAAWLAARGRPNAPERPPVSGDRPCGVGRIAQGTIARSGITMSQLADLVSPRVNRVVRDRTGLAGYFDLDLQWTPEQNTARAVEAPGPTVPLAVAPTGASLFTALQEQLGLKLESSKDLVEVLVIDRAEKPTED
jgi:bla regulator protein blaR1